MSKASHTWQTHQFVTSFSVPVAAGANMTTPTILTTVIMSPRTMLGLNLPSTNAPTNFRGWVIKKARVQTQVLLAATVAVSSYSLWGETWYKSPLLSSAGAPVYALPNSFDTEFSLAPTVVQSQEENRPQQIYLRRWGHIGIGTPTLMTDGGDAARSDKQLQNGLVTMNRRAPISLGERELLCHSISMTNSTVAIVTFVVVLTGIITYRSLRTA